MLVLIEIGVLCLWWLALLIHFMLILAHGYWLVVLLWYPCEDSLLFYKYWNIDGV
jgi:hypothetical protein